jgi:hypothetical protein
MIIKQQQRALQKQLRDDSSAKSDRLIQKGIEYKKTAMNIA